MNRSLLFLCIILFSCVSESSVDRKNEYEDLSELKELGRSFPGTTIKYAKGFEVSELPNIKIVKVKDLNNGSKEIQKFALSRTMEGEGMISLPIRTAACNSTTHVSYFSKLGIIDLLIGVSWPELIMNQDARIGIENGNIKEIGANGEMNLEVILKMDPEILMVYPYESLSYQQFEDAGLQLIYNTEYQETHPLAKAEWIKFYGILFDKEKEADQIFTEIEKRYMKLVDDVKRSVGERPKVFSGTFLNGQWFAPSPNSSTVRSLKDAGASYVFEDENQNGNIQLDFEVMYEKCKNADFYGRLVSEEIDLEDMREQEERMSNLSSVLEGNVFYCNTSEADYFGDAILEPEIILADLISIFHPSLDLEHKRKYFQLISE